MGAGGSGSLELERERMVAHSDQGDVLARQRDLSVSYNKLGDLHVSLGNGAEAKRYFEKSLAIAEALAAKEPNRADFQRDLAISYERMSTISTSQQAKTDWLAKSIKIRRALVARSKADAQETRALAVALLQRGVVTGQKSELREALEIFEDLERRNALDARYRPAIAKLRAMLQL